jgi:hypothetical protein
VKILKASRGDRPDDFCHTAGPEIVFPSWICDRTYGDCGCERAFTGLTSHQGTTIAEVAELDGLEFDLLVEMLHDHLRHEGVDDRTLAEDFAADLVETASEHEPGTRLRRQDEDVSVDA